MAFHDGHSTGKGDRPRPISVPDDEFSRRWALAFSVRHNRARGKHSVGGMSYLVFSMLDNGWSDEDICNELGMEPEVLLRLKHITGFSKLFEDHDYRRAWKTRKQILLEKQKTNGKTKTNKRTH
jgi:hypothetical protein